MKLVITTVGGTIAAVAALATTVYFVTRPPAPYAVREPAPPPPADAVQRGKLVYQAYGCAMCHGPEAKGGFANLNSESGGKVPGLVMVKEGYLERELVALILTGAPRIGKADPNGPTPPYRMPGWKDRMTRAEATDLVKYLVSLYPKKADEDKWK
jgi:mono/diheme cytochrome c family protein